MWFSDAVTDNIIHTNSIFIRWGNVTDSLWIFSWGKPGIPADIPYCVSQLLFLISAFKALATYFYLADNLKIIIYIWHFYGFSHSLLDQKIINLLRDCENLSVLSDVQVIIHNSLCTDSARNTHQASYLQSELLIYRSYQQYDHWPMHIFFARWTANANFGSQTQL